MSSPEQKVVARVGIDQVLEALGSGELSLMRRPTVPVGGIKRVLNEIANPESFNYPELRAILLLAKTGRLRGPDIERKANIPHSTFYKRVRGNLIKKGIVEEDGGYLELSEKVKPLRSLFE